MKAEPTIGASRLSRRGVLVAAAGTLFTAACGNGDDENSPGPTTRNSEEIVIGASLELTGSAAAAGTLQERALRLTADRLNEDGVPVGNLRRRVRLVIRDNESDPAVAAQQVTEMITRDNVHALLGGTTSETSMSIVNVAQEQQVPFLSLASSDDILSPLPERTYIYKLTPDASDVARIMAPLIATSGGGNRVAIIAAAGAHGESGVRAIQAFAAPNSLQVVGTQRLPASGGNARGAVQDALAAGPNAVVVWASAPDAGKVALALRTAKFEGQIFFEPTAVADDTVNGANRAAVEGAFAVHPVSLAGSSLTDTTRAELGRRDFVNQYIQTYDGFDGFAPYSSDGLTMIVNAARLARSVDHGRLRVFLETQVMEGIAGSYQFAPINHGGMAQDSLAVFTVSQGAWIRFS
jgi:branched-chain amino acid transport system substrate-binding protein